MEREETKSTVELLDIIDEKINLVRTKSLDLSFNEILDMYEDNEFIIDPSYQRLFRWPVEKESQFIESLLLEMPIPPIYVIEIEESVYELIDGLQRISSYLHFRGKLQKDILAEEELEGEIPPEILEIQNTLNEGIEEENDVLKLEGCDIIPELNGLTYEELPKTLQIRLKRSFVRVEVIRKGSDPRFRYYMFKRLNTGGEILSNQEVRNCTIRLLDDKFNNFIIELSSNPNYKNTMSHLNSEKVNRKENEEYILKYFAFKLDRDNYKKDIGPFLTKFMEKVSDINHPQHIEFTYDTEQRTFEKIFEVLNKTLGENAFDKKRQGGNYVSGTTSTHFDALTMGLVRHIESIDTSNEDLLSGLATVLEDAKINSEFAASASGGGKNTKRYLSNRIDVIERLVGEYLNGRS